MKGGEMKFDCSLNRLGGRRNGFSVGQRRRFWGQ